MLKSVSNIMVASEIEKLGWTVFEPALCECVNTKIAKIHVAGGVKDVFLLELFDLDNGYQIIKYFNVNRSKAGNYTVGRQSDFAKIYRITLGANPSARFSRAEQLLGHMRGQQFITEYREDRASNGSSYYKATSIKPAAPVITEEWFPSGILRCKRKIRNRQPHDIKLTSSCQKTSKKLATPIPANPAKRLGVSSNSNPIKDTTYKVTSLSHTDINVISDKEKVFTYRQQKYETYEAYLERVIDESW